MYSSSCAPAQHPISDLATSNPPGSVDGLLERIRKSRQEREAKAAEAKAAEARRIENVQSRRKSRRKNAFIDREMIFKTRSCRVDSASAPILSSSTSGVTPSPHTPTQLTNPSTDAPTATPIEDDGDLLSFIDGKPRPWRDTTEILRLTYFGRAIAARGVAIPFTLHVDPDQIDWRDPLKSIRKKINYHLAGRRFYAVAEFGADGTVHFQGHVEATDAGEREEITTALHRVSKGWREGRGASRAVWAGVDARTDGWAGYNAKTLEATRAEFDRRRRQLQNYSKRAPVISICDGDLRRDAEELYEADRQRLGARRCSWSRIASTLDESPARESRNATARPVEARKVEAPQTPPALEVDATGARSPGERPFNWRPITMSDADFDAALADFQVPIQQAAKKTYQRTVWHTA